MSAIQAPKPTRPARPHGYRATVGRLAAVYPLTSTNAPNPEALGAAQLAAWIFNKPVEQVRADVKRRAIRHAEAMVNPSEPNETAARCAARMVHRRHPEHAHAEAEQLLQSASQWPDDRQRRAMCVYACAVLILVEERLAWRLVSPPR